METELSVYEAVGGMDFFEVLVDRFYAGVAGDPVLVAIYPEPEDLAPARRHLTLFLAQYWGGPSTYQDERGHPALRRRHLQFQIGPGARDRWLLHMKGAIESLDPPPAIVLALTDYFDMAAESLRNLESDPG